MNEHKNTLSIYGKVTEIGDATTGETWAKQTFIIRIDENTYPKDICFNVWNKNINYLERVKVGDYVVVYFNLESRKHQDKFYTEVNAWKIEVDFLTIKKQSHEQGNSDTNR